MNTHIPSDDGLLLLLEVAKWCWSAAWCGSCPWAASSDTGSASRGGLA